MDPNLEATAHKKYRLWLTSYPSEKFPVAILQNSIKMTNESPKGLRMNMLKSYASEPLANDEYFSMAFEGTEAAQMWRRGVFALVFFHAAVQERKEYGPMGWNIPYEFTDSDLK